MKKTIIYILTALMLSLCACQKTPDTEAVINKGDNKAEKAIEASSDPAWDGAQPVFPERWEDDIKTEYKELIIDADVITNGQNEYPVALVRRGAFTSDDMKKLASYMFSDVTAWREGTSPTKEACAEALAYVSTLDMKEEEKSVQLDVVDSELKSATVSKANNKPCAAVDEIPFETDKGYSIVMASGMDGTVSSRKNEYLSADTHIFSIVQPEYWFISDTEEEKPDFTSDVSIEYAKAKADEILAYMGFEGFEMYRSCEARCVDLMSTEVLSKGRELDFVRTLGYAPFETSEYDASNGYLRFNDDEGSFSKALRAEVISIYVTENGVEDFYYANPYEYIGTANENVKLMDFDKLTAGISRTLTAAISNPNEVEGYYVIEELVLTAVPQYKKNSSDIYMMPVWVCKIGDYVSRAERGLSHFYIPGEQLFNGWITVAFNAIDGTRVAVS
ncbi:MAG: hypothetical protein IKX16_03425 [Clostridia bacterium]|nr:hypothetical protein [Clostridia bacterium]